MNTFRVALISNLVTGDIAGNQRRILELANQAADSGAKLIVFPEAAATDLINTGNPEQDRSVAESIPASRNEQWREMAIARGIYLAAGLLERDGEKLYDTGVFFDPQGKLVLRYRRNDPGWHYAADDPAVYCQGSEIPVVQTEFGSVGMLICGDLWDDGILSRFSGNRPDYLIYIMSRSLAVSDKIQQVWNEEELPDYCERWSKTGASVLAVNLYGGEEREVSIGGAWFVDNRGVVLDSLVPGREGILMVDLPIIL